MSTARPRRLLTVCLGNHCRSPLAALILAELGGPAVEVRSAGTRDKWVGKPAHAQMMAAAAAAGYDLTAHRGVHLTPGLLDWADTVLAMDGAILTALRALADETDAPKLGLYLADRDVPDPWGKGQEVFADVVRLIEDGAPRHLP
ncbi:arsenate reductase/protein-tyrosine-phosphatase family protein [Streptomyces rugosispiralis]|uniref:protein-tyrosine-phosphatase n=1 Tax=Streptomyces rugosispiralis TaxID=2967341 RepID=A0ABT1V875_9ACTN|nr:low molecular weight phosphotyrosine protein phosphatase [Streptomyces rugosispiralis]MCQ8193462.1 low molecular weight phosphotyrosine protein phosphatase [Streptomyces rugosispiralis]